MIRQGMGRVAHGAGHGVGTYGHNRPGAFIFIALAVLVAVGIGFLVAWLVKRHHRGDLAATAVTPGTGSATGYTGYVPTTAATPGSESPVEILKARYARGEIDKAEYEEKLKDLSS